MLVFHSYVKLLEGKSRHQCCGCFHMTIEELSSKGIYLFGLLDKGYLRHEKRNSPVGVDLLPCLREKLPNLQHDEQVGASENGAL